MATMTKRERVRAALTGGDVDRLPIMFWHHFQPHGSPQELADATLDFFGRHDLDIYKIMPDIPYPFPRDSIRAADDWLFLSPLDVLEGNLGRMVTAKTSAHVSDVCAARFRPAHAEPVGTRSWSSCAS